jgi:hypothetical protein
MLAAGLVTVLSASTASTTILHAADSCRVGGTLPKARDQEPQSLVPWDSTGNGGIFLQIQIYNRLVDQMPGANDLQPGLAGSSKKSAAGRSASRQI